MIAIKNLKKSRDSSSFRIQKIHDRFQLQDIFLLLLGSFYFSLYILTSTNEVKLQTPSKSNIDRNLEFGMIWSTSSPVIIGVNSTDEIGNAYKKLAMKWHPDRWAKDLVFAEEAKKRFQAIQEAYEVLKDRRKRNLFDSSGLCDLGTNNSEDVEGFGGFMNEMMTLMRNVRRKKNYSMDELREMLHGIAHGMDGQDTFTSSMCSTASGSTRGRNTKTSRFQTELTLMN